MIETNTFEFELIRQMQDLTIKELRARLERKQDNLYEICEMVSCIAKEVIRFFVPRAMERDLLHKYHNEFGLSKRTKL